MMKYPRKAFRTPDVTTRIMGVVGTRQHVQFAGIPGDRFIFATMVTADGRADFASVPVTITPCAAPVVAPISLHFHGARSRPDFVDFSVTTYDERGVEVPF